MSEYDPPKQIVPIFDVNDFVTDDKTPLTLYDAEKYFVKNINGVVYNTLTIYGGKLSIPSYPDVESTLNNITGITYDIINDTTTIDNALQVNKILYANQYIYATQIYSSTEFGIGTNGNIYLNMNDEGSVVISGGNIYNVNGSAIIQDGASGTNQLRSTNYTGNINMGTNTITNVSFSSTTVNTYADMKYDITNKTIYYKEPVYGQFSSTQTQTISNTTTPTLFTYNTTTNANNCVLNTTTSQIKVLVQGLYRISVSPNIEGTGNHTATFWFIKNGTNIPNSASQISTSGGKSLPFVEIFETMNVNDFIEIAALSTTSGQQITAIPASAPVPAIPSIIVTIQRLS